MRATTAPALCLLTIWQRDQNVFEFAFKLLLLFFSFAFKHLNMFNFNLILFYQIAHFIMLA